MSSSTDPTPKPRLSAAKQALLEQRLRGKLGPRVPAIPRRSQSGPVPLSFAQQRLWFLDQLEPGSAAYNLPRAIRLTGVLNIAALEQSFNEIVRRHEILRTTFTVVDGQPNQVIAPALPCRLAIIDLQSLPEAAQSQRVQQLASQAAQQPFDLTQGPLLRLALLQLSQTEQVLLLTLHHIVSDAWSTGVLVREMAALYSAFAVGNPCPLPELPIQYADFALWQRQRLQQVMSEQLAYWKQQLQGKLPVLQLPTPRRPPAIASNRGERQARSFPPALTVALKQLSQQQGVTLFMTLLAAFNTLLYRYTDQEDILVGSAIANRTQAETEGMIGFFVNTLVLRCDLSGNPSFRELLGRVRDVALAAYTHQDLPFEVLVEALQPQRNLHGNPLFQVMCSLQNAPVPPLALPGLTLESLKTDTGTALVDLSLDLVETAQGLSASMEYRTDLFSAAMIARLLEHFQVLLEGIVANPEQRLSDLPLLTRTDRQLLQAGGVPQVNIPNQCIHQLFEAQVERSPDAIAIVFGDQQLTYRQLNASANQLAHSLQTLGVGPGALVGLCVERSPEMVIGLFAILKAGGAYVPLDPAYPQERLAWMLQDAQVTVLLTYQRLMKNLPDCRNIQVVYLDQGWDASAASSRENLVTGVTPEDLAYLIYTSGSTGRPKGVLIQQRSLVNFSLAASRAYAIQPGDVVLQFASISFDAAAEEIFPCLVQGGRLVLRTDELSSVALLQTCRRFNLTVLDLPTAFWHQLTAELAAANLVLPACLRLVIIGGEPALPERLLTWQQQVGPQVRLVNSYGPTEATVVATISELSELTAAARVPIGQAIANVQTHVLDAQLQPTPVGVAGELYLGGAGVAQGYLHRPELTAEQFVPDPFSPLPGSRLYKTGDRGRYREDGQLEFLGRVDRQVKIRGYRIELAEIESLLHQHPAVGEAVVIAPEDPGNPRLVAYFVPQAGTTLVIPDLQRYLKTKLPAYMVPTAFVCLEALPLTPNGKVDRRALPAPERVKPNCQSFAPPRTPTEEILAGIWAQVLPVERVGRDDNFFDLGGHSLLATQVIARVRDHFQIELPLRCLFEAPTVAELTECIEAMRDSAPHQNIPPIVPAERHRPLPLSLAQQQLWFLHQLQPGSPAYNLPVAARLHGPLDVAVLERSFNEVIQRHEALRTTFTTIAEQPVQAIAPTLRLTLPVIDLRGLPEQRRQANVRELAAAAAQQPFDLEQGPLLRACLLQLQEREFVLLLTMHHIIADGWSLGVLLRELAELYAAFSTGQPSPLPELPIQYADFAVWQRQWLQGEPLQAHLAYWQQQLRGPLPVTLPTNRPRLPGPGRGASDRFQLSPDLAQALLALSRQEGVTLFMTLLAAFNVLLHRHTHQEDIVVGTDIASRDRAETEPLIGFFVNLLVLRTDLSGNPRFQELLRRVRQVTLAAYAHPVTFAKLVEVLQPQRHLQQTPLFQVLFVLQNTPLPTLALPGLTLQPLEEKDLDSGIAKFDLALFMEETPQGLRGTWRYNTDLFEATTIARLSSHFQTLLSSVLSQPEARIDTLEMLSELEKNQQDLEVTQQAERKFVTFKRSQPKLVRLTGEPAAD